MRRENKGEEASFRQRQARGTAAKARGTLKRWSNHLRSTFSLSYLAGVRRGVVSARHGHDDWSHRGSGAEREGEGERGERGRRREERREGGKKEGKGELFFAQKFMNCDFDFDFSLLFFV